MKTEKVAGRIVVLTTEEVYASLAALTAVMGKEFNEKSAYRIGKLQSKLEAIRRHEDKDRLDIFNIYGKNDGKGNINIPQPGPAPERGQEETDDDWNKRVSEHVNLTADNKGFQEDMAQLLKRKHTIEAPPIDLPANLTITPAVRMALAWLLGDEDLI